MTIVGAGILTVVEFDIDHGRTVETNLEFDDTVLGRHVEAMHGGVRGDGGLAVGGRDGLVAGLGALEDAVDHREGRDDLDPALIGGALPFEVIGEK